MAVKPEYRLRALLQIRERNKERAEKHWAACLQALRAEEKRLREMEQELVRMVAKRTAKIREYTEKTMRGEMSAQDAVSAQVYLERLKEREEAQKEAIKSQKEVVAEKQEAVKQARAGLTLAMQELKALEKHKEKWQDVVKRAELAKEEEAQDELAQSIYLRTER